MQHLIDEIIGDCSKLGLVREAELIREAFDRMSVPHMREELGYVQEAYNVLQAVKNYNPSDYPPTVFRIPELDYTSQGKTQRVIVGEMGYLLNLIYEEGYRTYDVSTLTPEARGLHVKFGAKLQYLIGVIGLYYTSLNSTREQDLEFRELSEVKLGSNNIAKAARRIKESLASLKMDILEYTVTQRPQEFFDLKSNNPQEEIKAKILPELLQIQQIANDVDLFTGRKEHFSIEDAKSLKLKINRLITILAPLQKMDTDLDINNRELKLSSIAYKAETIIEESKADRAGLFEKTIKDLERIRGFSDFPKKMSLARHNFAGKEKELKKVLDRYELVKKTAKSFSDGIQSYEQSLQEFSTELSKCLIDLRAINDSNLPDMILEQKENDTTQVEKESIIIEAIKDIGIDFEEGLRKTLSRYFEEHPFSGNFTNSFTKESCDKFIEKAELLLAQLDEYKTIWNSEINFGKEDTRGDAIKTIALRLIELCEKLTSNPFRTVDEDKKIADFLSYYISGAIDESGSVPDELKDKIDPMFAESITAHVTEHSEFKGELGNSLKAMLAKETPNQASLNDLQELIVKITYWYREKKRESEETPSAENGDLLDVEQILNTMKTQLQELEDQKSKTVPGFTKEALLKGFTRFAAVLSGKAFDILIKKDDSSTPFTVLFELLSGGVVAWKLKDATDHRLSGGLLSGTALDKSKENSNNLKAQITQVYKQILQATKGDEIIGSSPEKLGEETLQWLMVSAEKERTTPEKRTEQKTPEKGSSFSNVFFGDGPEDEDEDETTGQKSSIPDPRRLDSNVDRTRFRIQTEENIDRMKKTLENALEHAKELKRGVKDSVQIYLTRLVNSCLEVVGLLEQYYFHDEAMDPEGKATREISVFPRHMRILYQIYTDLDKNRSQWVKFKGKIEVNIQMLLENTERISQVIERDVVSETMSLTTPQKVSIDRVLECFDELMDFVGNPQ